MRSAGRRCRHNLVYWQFGDYLGIGAGAHGKLTRGRRRARSNARSASAIPRPISPPPTPRSAWPSRATVPAADLPFEFALNALRLVEGFAERRFEERTGLSRHGAGGPDRSRPLARGLLERSDGRWRPTALGRRFLNDLQALFLPA